MGGPGGAFAGARGAHTLRAALPAQMRAIQQRGCHPVVKQRDQRMDDRKARHPCDPAPSGQAGPDGAKGVEAGKELAVLEHMQAAGCLIRGQPPACGLFQPVKVQGSGVTRCGGAVMVDLEPAERAGVVVKDAGVFVGHAEEVGAGGAAPRPARPAATSELGVGPVAEGRLGRGLAAAEEHLLAVLGRHLDGGEGGALVAAVAEGLVLGLAAGAPEVGFARLHLDRVGGLLGDLRDVGHRLAPCWLYPEGCAAGGRGVKFSAQCRNAHSRSKIDMPVRVRND